MNSIQLRNELIGLKNFYEFTYYDKRKVFQIESLILELDLKIMNYSNERLFEQNSKRLNFIQSIINNIKESYE